jgi:acetylornithine deacetylase/succinyl-diaminopimelate desuccinylase-like protein
VQQQHRAPVLGPVGPHVEDEIADVDAQQLSRHEVDADPALPSVPVSSPERDNAERRYVLAHLDDLHADLDTWLRIPSISADPSHASDVAASAAWLAEALRRTGFPTVEIWPTPGAPAVFAEWRSADAGAPVALVYGHHDVQPVDPLELWEHPPFEPTLVEGPDGPELHARGAIDDKGNVAFHLLGMRAHLAATGRDTPAVTVKLLVEGEEESGSPHFAALLERNRQRLSCDVVVVSDTGMAAPDVPSVVTAMRGLADAEITLRGPAVDLHSGSFGGAVPNPLHAMARLLARLHDEKGRVTLPGFYDRVRPLGDRERELMARVPFDEDAWLKGPAASKIATGEEGFGTLERVGARPTAEVNGLWGGYTGPGHKTIIPAEAYAKLTFRLVADQRPEDVAGQLRAWVEANLPEGMDAEVHTPPGGVAPCASDLDSPWMDALLSAVAQAFDTEAGEVLFTREGGSGPEADLVEALGAPLLFLGAGLPTDRIHSPNERVLLPMLYRGAEAAAHLWRGLADRRA